MDRVREGSLWRCCPDVADICAGRETSEHLQASCEAGSVQEVSAGGAKLIVAVLVMPLHRRAPESADHPFYLPIGLWMARPCQAMPAPIGIADQSDAHLEERDAVTASWTCHGLVPVTVFSQAPFCSEAKGFFQPKAACRRRGL